MAGVILENISTKKLIAICIFLFSLSLACFIVGGFKVPAAAHTQTVIGNWCVWNSSYKAENMYPSRGSGRCKQMADLPKEVQDKISAEQVVFSFQYPLARDGKNLTMSRWFMYHVTVLSLNIAHRKGNEPVNGSLANMLVKVGYKDAGDDTWTQVLDGAVERKLYCEELHKKVEGYRYNCDFLDLFEIGNMHHDEYLVNIRLPPNEDTGSNTGLGHIEDIELVWFAQTGGFTLYFLVLKTVCFAMVLPLTIWNWKRVADLNRPPVFLEKLLLAVATAAIILNFPIDWLVLVTEMRFMLLWSDIRQGVFLSIILSYWLVFTGEHMVDEVKRGNWSSYWKQLATVMLASSLMFIFDLCERGVRIANPFFSIWSTSQGTMLGKAFIGIAIAASIVYCIILIGSVIKAIYYIWKKRSQSKSMAQGLRIHYMSIIYRFFFTLAFTAVCSTLTIISFAMGQVYESEWKWDLDVDDEDDVLAEDKYDGGYLQHSMKGFEVNTAFQLGMTSLVNTHARIGRHDQTTW